MTDSVKGLIKASPEILSFNLRMQWALFDAGCGDLLPGVLDPKTAGMIQVRLPAVGKGSIEKIRKFIYDYPKEHRLHIERQLLTARDESGENAPMLNLQERTLILAQRYFKEGGGPREFALADLAFFANDERCVAILTDHFLKQEEHHLLGARVEGANNGSRASQIRGVVWAAVMIALKKGDPEPALRQFQSIFGHPRKVWRLALNFRRRSSPRSPTS